MTFFTGNGPDMLIFSLEKYNIVPDLKNFELRKIYFFLDFKNFEPDWIRFFPKIPKTSYSMCANLLAKVGVDITENEPDVRVWRINDTCTCYVQPRIRFEVPFWKTYSLTRVLSSAWQAVLPQEFSRILAANATCYVAAYIAVHDICFSLLVLSYTRTPMLVQTH